MKKILLIIPIIICLIFSSMIILPFTAYSADPASLVYYSLSDFQNECNYDSSLFYFYVTFKRSESLNYTYSGYIQVDESKIKSVDYVDGVYHIEFTERVFLHHYTNTSSVPGEADFSSLRIYDVLSITYQPGLRCYFFDLQGKDFYPVGGSECILYDCQTNMFNADPSMPDVTVEFTPDLSGEVDRTITSSSGSKSLLQELKMTVTNNSSFPVQYRMTISLKNQITKRLESSGGFQDNKTYYSSRFDDDPVFVYYSDGEVYQVVGENSAQEDLNVQDVAKFHKATDWHYLNSGQTDDVTFDFSMINLTENCEYVCKVVAYKCDYDCASACLYSPQNNDDFPASPVFKQVDTTYFTEAYNSSFIMLQYSDIKYDPNKKANGVLPYDGSQGISSAKQYQYSYDSKTDPVTGEQKIGHVDLFNDPNSWINKQPSISSSNPFPNSDVDVSVSSFSGMFSNVFGFVSMFMNYLPSQIMAIFIFGFSCIVVIAIIKAVR